MRKIFAKRKALESARLLGGWTQKAFADELNKNYQWYNQAEKGKKSMSYETAESICEKLNVEFSQIFTLSEHAPGSEGMTTLQGNETTFRAPLSPGALANHMYEDRTLLAVSKLLEDSSHEEIEEVRSLLEAYVRLLRTTIVKGDT